MRTSSVIILFLAVSAPPSPAQQIRARVLDEASRAPIAGVVVIASKDNDVLRTETHADGFFTLRLPGIGTYALTLESIGYRKLTRSVVIEHTDVVTIPAFLLLADVIPIERVEATADRPPPDDVVGFNRKMFVKAGADLATLERNSISVLDALRGFGAGLKIHFTGRSRTPCIESSRGMSSMGPSRRPACDMVIILVDEIMINDAAGFLRTARLEQFESMQYLPPVEAGQRFGLEASARGAIVFWSRGRGPHKSPERN